MQFSLPFSPEKFPFEIKHGAPILLLGSCFSDELESNFKRAGFDILSNPFGTLFHPLALANVINTSLSEDEEIDLYQRTDLFFSWDTSSKIVGMTESELRINVGEQRRKFVHTIKEASTFIVTFGSAIGYRHKELGKIVANCHKAPQIEFEKELSTVDFMLEEWLKTIENLRKLNPNINLIFTVSPVRHSKDGLVLNNRSKSRLIELAHRLCEEVGAHYFPAYEIVVDQLRDYRFFKEDLVHPNKQASDHVWEQFCTTAFSDETRKIVQKVNVYHQNIEHIPIHPKSIEAQKHAAFIQKLKTEIKAISEHIQI